MECLLHPLETRGHNVQTNTQPDIVTVNSYLASEQHNINCILQIQFRKGVEVFNSSTIYVKGIITCVVTTYNV
jgi:hypothetical protein